MKYDSLTAAYWEEQSLRVEELRKKIIERTGTTTGRVVPETDDLVIGTGRRLGMAVLFLDISAFSTRPAETAAEQEILLRVMSLFFSEMVRIAEDYGGTVEKNTGDGLMAYFEHGGGIPPEDAATRSVASALTMFAANDYLIRPILSVSGVPPIEFRISIDYGEVTIARLGPAKRFNSNVAIGTAANISNKLLRLAQPGELLIGDGRRLPTSWQILWTEPYSGSSGWVYKLSGAPYPVFRYTGRWSKLT